MTSERPGRPPLTNLGAGSPERLVFSFRGGQVGCFEGIDAYPTEAGRYRYMPFRSASHYELGEECQRTGLARCSFPAPAPATGAVWFTVRSAGEYGFLEISDLGGSP